MHDDRDNTTFGSNECIGLSYSYLFDWFDNALEGGSFIAFEDKLSIVSALKLFITRCGQLKKIIFDIMASYRR